MAEAPQEVGGFEVGLGVVPAVGLDGLQAGPAGGDEGFVDDVAVGHGVGAVGGAEAGGQALEHFVVAAAFAGRFDQLGADLDVAVAAGLVEVMVFHEHGGGQDEVGKPGGLGHELFVDDGEQVFAEEAPADLVGVRGDGDRVGVLDQQGVDLGAGAEIAAIAGEDGADAALVQVADGGVDEVQALDQGLVPVINGAVVPEGAAALIAPFAGDGGQAGDGVQGCRTIAAAGEAIAGADIGAGVSP